MTRGEQRQREVLEIVLAASVGDASEAQLARLSQLVVEEEALAQYAVELLSQEAWLSWHGSQAHADRLVAELELPVVALQTAKARRPPARMWNWGWLASGLAAALLVGAGALVGGLAARWGIQAGQDRIAAVDMVPIQPEGAARFQLPSPYVARFVQGTACVWGPGSMPPPFEDGKLRSGESINLMEGLAEIELDLAVAGRSTLEIEGPARMVLTAEGTPSLMLGKFSADVQLGFGHFTLETPFGQLVVAEDSSLGVAVSGLKVEVHVFHGQVVVVSPWTSDGTSVDRFSIRSGESLRLLASESGTIMSSRSTAEPDRFASQVTMTSDRLPVSEEYVREVVRAAPILYWRFESLEDGVVRNEVGDRFHGVVVGAPDWSPQGNNNRAIELGSGLSEEALQAYIESSEPLGDLITHSYSVELWVKPSHYHLGTLVSLLQRPAASGEAGLHGMLLELGGQLATPTTIEHPGRIRFLHRHPPSNDIDAGTSCFSESPYELRRWTHVVAVKDGPEMRLYVNGEEVASADANTRLSEDLTVVVGQLDWHRHWRRFVGQLDELAIYNRALSDGEIRRRFELIRPRTSHPGTI